MEENQLKFDEELKSNAADVDRLKSAVSEEELKKEACLVEVEAIKKELARRTEEKDNLQGAFEHMETTNTHVSSRVKQVTRDNLLIFETIDVVVFRSLSYRWKHLLNANSIRSCLSLLYLKTHVSFSAAPSEGQVTRRKHASFSKRSRNEDGKEAGGVEPTSERNFRAK